MNVGYLIKKAVFYFPDNIAVADDNNRCLTFQQVYEKACSFANALFELGCRKGDCIAVMMPNSIEAFIAIMAMDLGGYIRIPINDRYSASEIAYLLDDSKSKGIVFSKRSLTVINDALSINNNNLDFLICNEQAEQNQLKNGIDFYSLINGTTPKHLMVNVEESDISYIAYTSGTTGKPKGAPSTHGRCIELLKILFIEPVIPFLESDVCMHIAPFTGASISMVMSHFVKGACNLVLSSTEISNALYNIEKNKVTRMLLVPTIINMFINHPEIDKYNLSSIRHIFYGASPISYSLLKKAIQRFGNIFEQFYGMAEASPATILLSNDHRIDGSKRSKKILSSAGKACYGVDLMVANELGEAVEPGEIGEIRHKGKHVFDGYWNKPELNSVIFKNGWFCSGDLATVDEEGYIYIVDRKHDMIISGGFNVYPREVEDILFSYEKVLEAAVIGVPDDKWGEAVKAIIVSKEKCSELEIIQYCKQKLAGYKIPKSVEFVDSIPKTGNVKIDKKQLRSKYWKGKNRDIN